MEPWAPEKQQPEKVGEQGSLEASQKEVKTGFQAAGRASRGSPGQAGGAESRREQREQAGQCEPQALVSTVYLLHPQVCQVGSPGHLGRPSPFPPVLSHCPCPTSLKSAMLKLSSDVPKSWQGQAHTTASFPHSGPRATLLAGSQVPLAQTPREGPGTDDSALPGGSPPPTMCGSRRITEQAGFGRGNLLSFTSGNSSS